MTTEEAKTWGGLIANAFIGFMLVWASHQRKVQNRKQNEHNDEQAVIARDTHTLVNSQNTAQKKTLKEVTAAKAAITNDPADIAAAKAALNDYADHVRKQQIVDTDQASDKTVKP